MDESKRFMYIKQYRGTGNIKVMGSIPKDKTYNI